MSRIFTGDNNNALNGNFALGPPGDATYLVWYKTTGAGGPIFQHTEHVPGATTILGVYPDFSVSVTNMGGDARVLESQPDGVWLPAIVRAGSGVKSELINRSGSMLTPGNYGPIGSDGALFVIGAMSSGGAGFNGKIAHMTKWNAVLNDGQVSSLLAGMDPSKVNSSQLEEYWPMVDGSLVGAISGKTLTVAGTVPLDGADNPVLYTAAAGSFSPPATHQTIQTTIAHAVV